MLFRRTVKSFGISAQINEAVALSIRLMAVAILDPMHSQCMFLFEMAWFATVSGWYVF